MDSPDVVDHRIDPDTIDSRESYLWYILSWDMTSLSTQERFDFKLKWMEDRGVTDGMEPPPPQYTHRNELAGRRFVQYREDLFLNHSVIPTEQAQKLCMLYGGGWG